MSDFYLNIKASEIGKSLQDIGEDVKQELSNALEGIVSVVYNQGVIYAQQRLKDTRLQYLSGYHYQKLGDNLYLIYLDDEVNFLEQGYSQFDMKPGLLNGPKSKPTKSGGRYNTVPFRHMPYSGASGNMAQQQLKQNLLDTIKSRKLDRIFKDKKGMPREGVVARVTGNDLAANLQGLVKVQKNYEKTTQSYYMTFRRVSDKSDPSKWVHPGYKGLKLFDFLEKFTDEKITEVLNEIL